jgi:hypothetical protein
MFPDVPDMWAKDAVAALAAKGILEGYPDGTFKGDRAATRYEVAMIVARLLAKMEQEHATFATKADLDELRRLVNQLKDELDALGVRVQNLEDNVARLDKRVTELERITFYGSLDTRFVSMRINNTGLSTGTNSNQAGAVAVAQPGGVAFNVGTGGPFPTAFGAGANPTLPVAFAGPFGAVNPVATYPSVLGVLAAQGSLGAFVLPNGVFVGQFGPSTGLLAAVGGTPAPGTFAVLGTGGATAPIPGFPTATGANASIALTGVGVPAAFISGNAPGLPGGIAGRPVFINEFKPNTASFNTDNLSTAANPSYNAVVGSNRSLGGNVFSAPTGIATGGNPFTGTTGFVGVNAATPLILGTFEQRTGRPWTNGTGFSGQGILGVRIKLNPDMDAGAEFAAYYSTGDPIVDAFYGVSAVRQSNVFASNQALAGLDAGQGDANNPWNKMVIDNFWFLHKPSNIKVQIGSYGDTHMDSIVYQPEYNPNYFGPRYLDDYGFRVSGKHHLLAPFEWEVFGSNVADGNRLTSNFPGALALGATPYKPYLWGVDGKWTFGSEGNQGRFKVNAMRIWDDNSSGQATTVGSIVGVNGVWTDWANPSGYFAAQLSPQYNNNTATGTINPNAGRVAGIGSTSDARPIIPNIAGNGGGLGINAAGNRVPTAPVFGIDQTGSGLLGTTTAPLLAALGAPVNAALPTSSFGPQSMFTWGASGGWDYSWNDNVKMRFFGEYGNSDYKPSANSSYHSPTGEAWRVGLGFTLFSDFDLDGEYLSVNPYYNPYVLQYPNVNGVTQSYWRIPSLSWFPEMYPVSDKDIYPNNRQGFRVNFKWNPVDPKDGKHKTVFYGEYGNMQQQTTSLQSIRYSPGSANGSNNTPIPGTGVGGIPAAYDPNGIAPNGFVLGQNPGYVDTVFTGYHPTSFAGYTGSFLPSSVNQFSSPLENPTGRVTNWGVGVNYRFDSLGGLGIHAAYKDYSFNRPSSLTPQFGGSENNINLDCFNSCTTP